MGTDGSAAQVPSGDAEHRSDGREPWTREELAARLTEIVQSLDDDYEELSQEWPPADETRLVEFWAAHMEMVKGRIDEIQHVANECINVTGTGPGQSPPEPLNDLTAGLLKARQAVQAALRAFQVPDDAVQSEAQSTLHMKAIQQLARLSRLCSALAKHLLGPQGSE